MKFTECAWSTRPYQEVLDKIADKLNNLSYERFVSLEDLYEELGFIRPYSEEAREIGWYKGKLCKRKAIIRYEYDPLPDGISIYHI